MAFILEEVGGGGGGEGRSACNRRHEWNRNMYVIQHNTTQHAFECTAVLYIGPIGSPGGYRAWRCHLDAMLPPARSCQSRFRSLPPPLIIIGVILVVLVMRARVRCASRAGQKPQTILPTIGNFP